MGKPDLFWPIVFAIVASVAAEGFSAYQDDNDGSFNWLRIGIWAVAVTASIFWAWFRRGREREIEAVCEQDAKALRDCNDETTRLRQQIQQDQEEQKRKDKVAKAEQEEQDKHIDKLEGDLRALRDVEEDQARRLVDAYGPDSGDIWEQKRQIEHLRRDLATSRQQLEAHVTKLEEQRNQLENHQNPDIQKSLDDTKQQLKNCGSELKAARDQVDRLNKSLKSQSAELLDAQAAKRKAEMDFDVEIGGNRIIRDLKDELKRCRESLEKSIEESKAEPDATRTELQAALMARDGYQTQLKELETMLHDSITQLRDRRQLGPDDSYNSLDALGLLSYFFNQLNEWSRASAKKIDDCAENIKKAKEEVQEEAQKHIDDLITKVQKLETKSATSEHDHQVVNDLQNQVRERQNQITQLQQALQGSITAAEAAKAEAKFNELEKQKGEIERNRDQLAREQNKLQQELDVVKEQLTAAVTERNIAITARDALQNSNVDLNNDIINTEMKLGGLQGSLDYLQNNCNYLLHDLIMQSEPQNLGLETTDDVFAILEKLVRFCIALRDEMELWGLKADEDTLPPNWFGRLHNIIHSYASYERLYQNLVSTLEKNGLMKIEILPNNIYDIAELENLLTTLLLRLPEDTVSVGSDVSTMHDDEEQPGPEQPNNGSIGRGANGDADDHNLGGDTKMTLDESEPGANPHHAGDWDTQMGGQFDQTQVDVGTSDQSRVDQASAGRNNPIHDNSQDKEMTDDKPTVSTPAIQNPAVVGSQPQTSVFADLVNSVGSGRTPNSVYQNPNSRQPSTPSPNTARTDSNTSSRRPAGINTNLRNAPGNPSPLRTMSTIDNSPPVNPSASNQAPRTIVVNPGMAYNLVMIPPPTQAPPSASTPNTPDLNASINNQLRRSTSLTNPFIPNPSSFGFGSDTAGPAQPPPQFQGAGTGGVAARPPPPRRNSARPAPTPDPRRQRGRSRGGSMRPPSPVRNTGLANSRLFSQSSEADRPLLDGGQDPDPDTAPQYAQTKKDKDGKDGGN